MPAHEQDEKPRPRDVSTAPDASSSPPHSAASSASTSSKQEPSAQASEGARRRPQTPGQLQALNNLFGGAYGQQASAMASPIGSGPAGGETAQKQSIGTAGGGRPQSASAQSRAGLRLQTAQDSRVVVSSQQPGRYEIAFRTSEDQGGVDVVVATFQRAPDDHAPLNQLPIHVEDTASGNQILIRVKYDPKRVTMVGLDEVTRAEGYLIQTLATSSSPEDLMVKQPPKAKRQGKDGYTLETDEKITTHSSTQEDRIASSIARAEGGFATVEAADAGIFTWGQGQWTVTGDGELQHVLAFIKEHRRDLFDRYWGSAGLDVQGKPPRFHYQRRDHADPQALMLLFRSSPEQNLAWTNLFAQAGMDPQIQRLQRQILRREVRQFMDKPFRQDRKSPSYKPAEWLNERGQSFFYSAYKNYPATAIEFLQGAVQAIGEAANVRPITDEVKSRISQEFEERFRNSSTVAFEQIGKDKNHHIYAFWGEGGRARALSESDQHIANPAKDDPWKAADWAKHRKSMENHDSRYKNTAGDVNRALNHKAESALSPDSEQHLAPDLMQQSQKPARKMDPLPPEDHDPAAMEADPKNA